MSAPRKGRDDALVGITSILSLSKGFVYINHPDCEVSEPGTELLNLIQPLESLGEIETSFRPDPNVTVDNSNRLMLSHW